MDAPTPDEVRRTLGALDAQQEKIVAGMLTVMIREPQSVRDREWIARQLTEMTLLAGEFEVDTPDAGLLAVHAYLQAHAEGLLNAAYLLFQRVGLDLAPQASTGFTFEEALRRGLEYLPSTGKAERAAAKPVVRDLGEQPIARRMAERGLKPADLVAASSDQLTHKMVARAMKGRRLTANTMGKVRRAWKAIAPDDEGALFDYEP